MRHILSAEQYNRDNLGEIFEKADFFRDQQASIADRRVLMAKHKGRVMDTSFYEPSTRTRKSFESAGLRLGMSVISSEDAGKFSSAAKGETIQDSVRVVEGYADVIVMRHPWAYSAEQAASAVQHAAIINGGDGGNEHPTQAALDAYTINDLQGRLDGLRVAFGGDLRFGRTVRSLVNILSRVYEDNEFVFIAPEALQVSDDIAAALDERGVTYTRTEDRDEGVQGADVVYWTRLQEERLEDPEERAVIERAIASGAYIIDQDVLRFIKPTASILHPLPRVGEIDPSVDGAIQAKYFEQAHNGVPVRQALLDIVIGNLER